MSILRKSSVTVPEFHAAAPRAMSAVLSSLGPLSVMGSGKTYQVSLVSTNYATAAVDWTELPGGVVKIQLALPALKADARITRAEADKFGAYWVHELCHVLFTEDSSWRVACSLGAEVKNLTNGLEDARIEAKLIASGALPGAREMLSSLLSSMVSEMPKLSTAGAWGHRSRWPWTLAVMGRAALWGFSHPALPAVSSLPLPLQKALSDLVNAGSTADCVTIARDLALALANPAGVPNGKPGGSSPTDSAPGDGAGDGAGEEGAGAGEDGDGAGEGQAAGPRGGQGAGAGAGSGEDFANDGQGADPDISTGFNRMSRAIAGGNRGTDGEADAANALAAARARKSISKAGVRIPPNWEIDALIAAQESRLAEMGAGALRASIRNMLRAPEARATRRYQDSGRLDLRGLYRIDAGRVDVFTRKTHRPGVETAVGVLCDASGSMGSGAYRVERLNEMGVPYGHVVQLREIAADTGRAIVDACNFAGAPVMAAVFNTHTRWLIGGKVRSKSLEARTNWAKAAVYSDGSTATVRAMLSMARELSESHPAMRKVMLVLTDGEADEGPTGVRAACHFCLSEFGVECIGVGMGYDIGDQYPMAVTLPVHDAKPETFLAILAKGLAKGAPSVRAA